MTGLRIKSVSEVPSAELFVNRRTLLGDGHGRWVLLDCGVPIGLYRERGEAESMMAFIRDVSDNGLPGTR